eukprot:gene7035-11200_t
MTIGKCLVETVLGLFVGTLVLLMVVNLSLFVSPSSSESSNAAAIKQKIHKYFVNIKTFFVDFLKQKPNVPKNEPEIKKSQTEKKVEEKVEAPKTKEEKASKSTAETEREKQQEKSTEKNSKN